jgi:hypothetical protein
MRLFHSIGHLFLAIQRHPVGKVVYARGDLALAIHVR